MKKRPLFLLGFILIVIVLAVFIDIPRGPFWGQQIKASLGLDLVGGTELIYQADLAGSKDRLKDLNNLKSVFEKRINELGVAEPSLQTSGGDKIIIELPGIKDINQAIQKIGATYELSFLAEGSAQDGVQLPDYYDPSYVYPGYWKKTELSGKDLDKADVTFESGSTTIQSDPVTSIKFTNAGKEKFRTLTKDNLNKKIAIVLDNKIVSAPTVQTEITNGEAIITGAKDVKDAEQLAKRLNEGMLPVPASLVGQQNVGATLGKDSLKQSIVAGLIGIIIIALFILIFYKIPGIVAIFSLFVYALITLAFYKIIPITLTLAGIAGFILSVGMAIDANILIFERLKEELKAGKELNLAIQDGFKRSWSSIRDSNTSSIITCVILYFATGSGPVRGFALTLLVGILISLFTAITLTRTLLLLLARSRMRRYLHV